MVTLLGVGDTPPCEKRPPQESRPVAWLLHQPEVDVKHQILSGVEAQQVDDMIQLLSIRDLENPLSLLLFLLRLAVKRQVKGSAEQLGQPGGEVWILRDDPHLRRAEGVAVEQDPVGLCPRAAQLLHRQAAQLVFRIVGKGHSVLLSVH